MDQPGKSLVPTPNASQIETCALPSPATLDSRQRVVLLGASNLSIMFPTIVETVRAMFAGPVEFHVAKGFGRSYGQESKFFGKKFSGILQSNLWPSLDRLRGAPTAAVVADVGNDLAYETPVERIVEWIERTLDLLASHDARIVLNNLPWESLRQVGEARYRLFRTLLFPRCTLQLAEMLYRAERLSDAMNRTAGHRKIPVFSGENIWYGLDPIHPRRAAAGEIWRRMLGAFVDGGGAATMIRPPARTALRYRLLKPMNRSQFGDAHGVGRPSLRCPDGTTASLY